MDLGRQAAWVRDESRWQPDRQEMTVGFPLSPLSFASPFPSFLPLIQLGNLGDRADTV